MQYKANSQGGQSRLYGIIPNSTHNFWHNPFSLPASKDTNTERIMMAHSMHSSRSSIKWAMIFGIPVYQNAVDGCEILHQLVRYPLVNVYMTMENHYFKCFFLSPISTGPFSIVMLNYQRVKALCLSNPMSNVSSSPIVTLPGAGSCHPQKGGELRGLFDKTTFNKNI